LDLICGGFVVVDVGVVVSVVLVESSQKQSYK